MRESGAAVHAEVQFSPALARGGPIMPSAREWIWKGGLTNRCFKWFHKSGGKAEISGRMRFISHGVLFRC
jgi:hypothetical protein